MSTILLVDDDLLAREALALALRGSGFTVLTAGDGQEALDRLDATEVVPNLILLDLVMPGMNGWDFRERLLERPRFAEVPVVIITGSEMSPPPRVNAIMRKPVDPTDLGELAARYR